VLFAAVPVWADQYVATEEALKQVLKPSTKLLLLGDSDHLSQNIPATVGHMLEPITRIDPAYNCLFVEFDMRVQPAIDRFYKTKNSEIRKEFADFQKNEAPEDLRNAPYATRASPELFNSAKKLNIKIFAVDVNGSSEDGKKAMAAHLAYSGRGTRNFSSTSDFAKHTLQKRNEIMVQNVNSRMKSAGCKKALVLVGDSHLRTTDLGGNKLTTIGQLLEQKNYGTGYIKVLDYRCLPGVPERDCRETDEYLQKNPLALAVPASGDKILPAYLIFARKENNNSPIISAAPRIYSAGGSR
jgi:hypothetical protein